MMPKKNLPRKMEITLTEDMFGGKPPFDSPGIRAFTKALREKDIKVPDNPRESSNFGWNTTMGYYAYRNEDYLQYYQAIIEKEPIDLSIADEELAGNTITFLKMNMKKI